MPTTATLMSEAIDRAVERVRSAGVATGFMRWLWGGWGAWGGRGTAARSRALLAGDPRSARCGLWGGERRGVCSWGATPARGVSELALRCVLVVCARRASFRSG